MFRYAQEYGHANDTFLYFNRFSAGNTVAMQQTHEFARNAAHQVFLRTARTTKRFGGIFADRACFCGILRLRRRYRALRGGTRADVHTRTVHQPCGDTRRNADTLQYVRNGRTDYPVRCGNLPLRRGNVARTVGGGLRCLSCRRRFLRPTRTKRT